MTLNRGFFPLPLAEDQYDQRKIQQTFQILADRLDDLERPLDDRYTITNRTEDRVLDCDATSTAELADVLGTLIEDLKSKGVI